ncbi:hypothetical protein WN943_018448 [Citrus x changshan-huyou]
MQSMATSKPKMRLKLLIDRKDDRVIFAEASKDFVDFLFHLFSLPIGTAVKVLGPQSMVGCIESANTGALVEGGFAKGVVTYMVMDNLKVMPMSTISTITLLNNYNVNDIGALEEKIVYVGMTDVC